MLLALRNQQQPHHQVPSAHHGAINAAFAAKRMKVAPAPPKPAAAPEQQAWRWSMPQDGGGGGALSVLLLGPAPIWIGGVRSAPQSIWIPRRR